MAPIQWAGPLTGWAAARGVRGVVAEVATFVFAHLCTQWWPAAWTGQPGATAADAARVWQCMSFTSRVPGPATGLLLGEVQHWFSTQRAAGSGIQKVFYNAVAWIATNCFRRRPGPPALAAPEAMQDPGDVVVNTGVKRLPCLYFTSPHLLCSTRPRCCLWQTCRSAPCPGRDSTSSQ